ncbi:MAG: hypothetical protein LBT99_00170, partial [Bifidobacteriaceae bacterium]|nr:hypothetical protein [Bifidobacteriaceae bacterium]
LLIGTVALLNNKDKFNNLQLLVIDEQHKFGVSQRNSINDSNYNLTPHIISMSATPIPRTVALSIFANYKIVTLQVPTNNQSPKITKLINLNQNYTINYLKKQILQKLENKKQIIIIVPRIKDSIKNNNSKLANIITVYKQYSNDPLFANYEISFIHGQMPSDAKAKIMNKMNKSEIDILISTTVIEVGVDLPQASTIVIYNADGFSISQLHQLRGRVGRNRTLVKQAFCFLLYNSPIKENSYKKLKALVKYTDGFELSEIDLKLRGEGDILGKIQSGKKSNLKIMRILESKDLLKLSYKLANKYINSDYFNYSDVKKLTKNSQQIYINTNDFLNKI